MATFPEDFRSFLVASTSLADALGSTVAVHYNRVPQGQPRAYIWFRSAADTVLRTMDKVGGIHQANYDVEIIADTEATAQSVSDKLHTKADGFKGTVSTATAHAIFLRDKDDQYEPRGLDDDEGRHVIAFDMEVWYST